MSSTYSVCVEPLQERFDYNGIEVSLVFLCTFVVMRGDFAGPKD